MRDIDDVYVIENRDRRTATQLVDDLLKKRLQHDFGVDRAEIARADRQHFRPQEKAPAAAPDVAERFERVQRATGGRWRQLRQRRDLAQRELRMFARKRLQDAQPSLE